MKNTSFIAMLAVTVGSGLMLGMLAFNATEPRVAPAPAPVAGNAEAPAAAASPSATAPAPSDADIPSPPPPQEDNFGSPPPDSNVVPGAPGSANPQVQN